MKINIQNKKLPIDEFLRLLMAPTDLQALIHIIYSRVFICIQMSLSVKTVKPRAI